MTDEDADMKLPEGKTCNDCASIKTCKAFIGIKGTETTCDWYPVRFRPALSPGSERGGGSR